MRPAFSKLPAASRFVSPASESEPGLPEPLAMLYNSRQNLPLTGSQQQTSSASRNSRPSSADHPRSRSGHELAGRPVSPEHEAEMDSPRPETESSQQDASNSPQSRQGETRAERLQRIRREIELGIYETPEKLEKAIDRMMGVIVD